jgi:glutamate-1-semialdehyde 2,1-aminomutase
MRTDQDLYALASDGLIPAGTQLLSKRPQQYAPGCWPAYFREARGIEITNVNGHRYLDFSMTGIGATLLGFCDPDVNDAVRRCVDSGNFSTLNPPEEVELAERLCELHPWAQAARFARTGGEIAAVAVRIARATTDRSKVAVCGYHGWHDWYLAANLGDADALRGHLLPGLSPVGVPRQLRGTTLPFRFGDFDAFDQLIRDHGDDLACVIMEPCRRVDPPADFLEHVRAEAHRIGALLIFDEITVGFRRVHGGAHLRLGVDPDMAIFAKSLGNGYPMAAVLGTRAAMAGAHDSFISSTYWTERLGPVAALATLDKMQRVDVPAYIDRTGRVIEAVWRKHIESHNVPIVIEDHYPCFAGFRFDHEQADELRAMFIQQMLQRGFLATPQVYVCLAHDEVNIEPYDTAIDEVFSEIADAVRCGDVSSRLTGPIAQKGFQRLV